MFGILLSLLTLVHASTDCIYGDCNHEFGFNVMDYGARGDGDTDNSQAFLEAWNDACTAPIASSILVVPPNATFVLNPIVFNGPCLPTTLYFMISGTIRAPEWPSAWEGKDASEWLGFKNISGLNVDGFGTVDGSGQRWWDQSCRYHPQLKECTKLAPTAMKFLSCNGTHISNMKVINSSQTHILMQGCNDSTIDNVLVSSPANSPNTDGIHIHSSHRLLVTNSKIATGDDCISIGDQISDIKIDNIECGPGHGISIGSLGRLGNYVQVERIQVSHSFFNGTTNGVRIKTWQVGRGYVRDITFDDILLENVQNPIIIDQNYCDVRYACKEEKTGVGIMGVSYKNIRGTSSTRIAINLNCSSSVPCTSISMESIQLVSAKLDESVVANCSSAYGQELDVFPDCCVQNPYSPSTTQCTGTEQHYG